MMIRVDSVPMKNADTASCEQYPKWKYGNLHENIRCVFYPICVNIVKRVSDMEHLHLQL